MKVWRYNVKLCHLMSPPINSGHLNTFPRARQWDLGALLSSQARVCSLAPFHFPMGIRSGTNYLPHTSVPKEGNEVAKDLLQCFPSELQHRPAPQSRSSLWQSLQLYFAPPLPISHFVPFLATFQAPFTPVLLSLFVMLPSCFSSHQNVTKHGEN